jgi:hypothetical protein
MSAYFNNVIVDNRVLNEKPMFKMVTEGDTFMKHLKKNVSSHRLLNDYQWLHHFQILIRSNCHIITDNLKNLRYTDYLMSAYNNFPGERRTAGNGPDATENHSKLEAVFRPGISGFFSVYSDKFQCFPPGSIRKSLEKIPENFRREYCFHVPDMSLVSVQDPVASRIFPARSCGRKDHPGSLMHVLLSGKLPVSVLTCLPIVTSFISG